MRSLKIFESQGDLQFEDDLELQIETDFHRPRGASKIKAIFSMVMAENPKSKRCVTPVNLNVQDPKSRVCNNLYQIGSYGDCKTEITH